MTFPYLASKIRKACPHGFVLTEYVRERFGVIAALYLSAFSCLTIFVYMCSELTSVNYVVVSLTGLNGLPATIVEVVITAIYTAVGGFRTSLITDNIQGTMIVLLLVVCSVAVGTQVKLDQQLIDSSNLTGTTLLGWQLVYILPVAIVFNNYFLSGFWQRAFASKTDKDLWWGCTGASIFLFIILTLVGFTGIIAVWDGSVDPSDPVAANSAFFFLLVRLPTWVVGFCIVFALTMSCAAYDTLQCALVATISNDVFRNRISLWWVRLILVVNVPAVVVATKNLNVLTLYLIADLVSASLLPPILLGLVPRLYFLNGVDIMVGGFGGFFSVFLAGLIYYDGDARRAAGILILESGIFAADWSAFIAFAVSPPASLVWTAMAFLVRLTIAKIRTRFFGAPWTIFDRKAVQPAKFTDDVMRVDPAAPPVTSLHRRRSPAEAEEDPATK